MLYMVACFLKGKKQVLRCAPNSPSHFTNFDHGTDHLMIGIEYL